MKSVSLYVIFLFFIVLFEAHGELSKTEQKLINKFIKFRRGCICTREYFPICGTDKKTYSNLCTFNCAQQTNASLKLKYLGECSVYRKIPNGKKFYNCNEFFHPDCATNYVPYVKS